MEGSSTQPFLSLFSVGDNRHFTHHAVLWLANVNYERHNYGRLLVQVASAAYTPPGCKKLNPGKGK